MSAGDLTLHLKRSGLSTDAYVGQLHEIDNAKAVAQIERSVDYAGPLAGHKCGMFNAADGRKLLVTSSPKLIEPKRGKWPTLRKFFEQLLGTADEVLFAWMKVSLESLESGDMRPGQMIVFAGEAGCGKSLCQQIITQLLGGRCEKPFRYMVGDTPFNGDLGQAEHWCIEDEHGSTDIRTRRKFGTAIKDVCANTLLSLHRKGAQALSLPVFRRITMSVNSEPENLQIIPPLDGSLLDKITIFSCGRADVDSNRERAWKAFTGELSAFVYWLSNDFIIPQGMKCKRFGVKAYQDEALLNQLSSESPEQRLLNIVDEVIFDVKKDLAPEIVTADELERRLRSSPFNFTVEKLLYFSSACAVYLQRLETKTPSRISSSREWGKRKWTIKPPQA